MARYEDHHVGRLRVGYDGNDARAKDLAQVPTSATITVGAEAANVINVAVQLYGMNGKPLTTAGQVTIALCSDAAGLNFGGTDAALSTAIGTDGSLVEVVADSLFEAISEADGDIDIDFTKTDAGSKYLVILFPWGHRQISDVMTWT